MIDLNYHKPEKKDQEELSVGAAIAVVVLAVLWGTLAFLIGGMIWLLQ